jgi:hypothetical protein
LGGQAREQPEFLASGGVLGTNEASEAHPVLLSHDVTVIGIERDSELTAMDDTNGQPKQPANRSPEPRLCHKELTSAGFGPLTRAIRGLEAEDADTEYNVFVEGVTETTVRTNQIPLVKHKAVSGNTCCSFCGRDRKRVLNVCERCQSVFYCDVRCQRAHFQLGGHKEVCREAV